LRSIIATAQFANSRSYAVFTLVAVAIFHNSNKRFVIIVIIVIVVMVVMVVIVIVIVVLMLGTIVVGRLIVKIISDVIVCGGICVFGLQFRGTRREIANDRFNLLPVQNGRIRRKRQQGRALQSNLATNRALQGHTILCERFSDHGLVALTSQGREPHGSPTKIRIHGDPGDGDHVQTVVANALKLFGDDLSKRLIDP
jgi:hypothetical protein